jgi:hypothetical protein
MFIFARRRKKELFRNRINSIVAFVTHFISKHIHFPGLSVHASTEWLLFSSARFKPEVCCHYVNKRLAHHLCFKHKYGIKQSTAVHVPIHLEFESTDRQQRVFIL